MDVPTIVSERLELIWLSPGSIEALLAGERERAGELLGFTLPEAWPDEDTSGFLRYRLRQMTARPDDGRWLVRAMVLRDDDRPMVGHIGFHGPPDDRGRPEIGYTVFPAFRRRGLADEAARALMAWAADAHAITRFLASVSPTNAPSLGLIAKLGFRQTGAQWDDEDGLELVFQAEA